MKRTQKRKQLSDIEKNRLVDRSILDERPIFEYDEDFISHLTDSDNDDSIEITKKKNKVIMMATAIHRVMHAAKILPTSAKVRGQVKKNHLRRTPIKSIAVPLAGLQSVNRIFNLFFSMYI